MTPIRVKNNLNKFNFKLNNSLLSPNQWFDYALVFVNGFAPIKMNDKGWNFINTKGELLSPNQWFDDGFFFDTNGFAKVILNNNKFYIDINGSLHKKNRHK